MIYIFSFKANLYNYADFFGPYVSSQNQKVLYLKIKDHCHSKLVKNMQIGWEMTEL